MDRWMRLSEDFTVKHFMWFCFYVSLRSIMRGVTIASLRMLLVCRGVGTILQYIFDPIYHTVDPTVRC